MSMRAIDGTRTRLDAATSLASTLAAGWDAFELIGAVSADYADRVSGAFATWMSAIPPSCEGRDALGFAPSMPEDIAPAAERPDVRTVDEDQAADLLAELAAVLCQQLQAAAAQAVIPEDAKACQRGADAAAEIRELLAQD
jgi:hypothetical protein